jgi:hypothetical protein
LAMEYGSKITFPWIWCGFQTNQWSKPGLSSLDPPSQVKEGFSFIYSPNSPEMQELEQIFRMLDKDGSGTAAASWWRRWW